ncbi:hypothetical protein PoB_007030300 [Plakobranchus ocellatus]|uniref:Uncharacterized protein n=1 Tax=Plakobranchus ocellatus TaxID=259542 RepID=A0AAV4DHU5_9GAST|nr:hypothetical protein PoB_007030300 [Plakobranchus ocellatus]
MCLKSHSNSKDKIVFSTPVSDTTSNVWRSNCLRGENPINQVSLKDGREKKPGSHPSCTHAPFDGSNVASRHLPRRSGGNLTPGMAEILSSIPRRLNKLIGL